MTVPPEKYTQERVIELFRDSLGYEYLGDWTKRKNSNIEEGLLSNFLKKTYSQDTIKDAIKILKDTASAQQTTLYQLNKNVYSKLRYGIKIREELGKDKETVKLVDWDNPENNDFYIAEEVTIKNKRPDIVLYVNGIAIAVIELKKSSKSVADGIRQNLDNQKPEFIMDFFATIQLVMAGNDSEGLRYATTNTSEKYYLSWKEDAGISEPLDNHLYALCNKKRLLEIVHDFLVFDRGTKKICRHNQYFGVKAAQESLKAKEGGIIWHTQGSGKSLVMIWLAKWIRENIDNSRVLIITDRIELDDQIEKFFNGVNEKIIRTKNGGDLREKLMQSDPWLMCSLIHKFRNNSIDNDYEKFLNELDSEGFDARGNIHVFVDECHRTQSGKLHDAMKKLLPNTTIIGFTGTPLLKKDKKTTLEKFGKYIHTYKYDEALADKVILDLIYSVRDIQQNLSSPEKIDEWFEKKTEGLTDYAKTKLKRRWGTLRKVFSSKQRLEKIIVDIMYDMEMNSRLAKGNGNALLVTDSVYNACRLYDLFQNNDFTKCAIITSYDGDIRKTKGHTVSPEEKTEEEYKQRVYSKMLKDYADIGIGNNNHKEFEKQVKEKFVNEPGQMKLLIVVDKLLTGFDAPPATYLYIDKTMKDHGLFQAICRVNRLDEGKEFGYVVDYMDLFKSMEKAITDYTSEAFEDFEKDDVLGLLKNRITNGKKRLESALEDIQRLCEPVKPSKGINDYYEYFCGSSNQLDNTEQLRQTEPQRKIFYNMTATLLRAYANLASDMTEAGFSREESCTIREQVKDYDKIKRAVMLRSGEFLDQKQYEPAMRHLIDNYIDAEDSKELVVFDLPLVQSIAELGIHKVIDNFPLRVRENNTAVSETIEANVRRMITEENPTNPAFYGKMSELLNEIITDRKNEVTDNQEYIKRISDMCKQLVDPTKGSSYPENIKTQPQKILYDNLDKNEVFVLKLDQAILLNKPDAWDGDYIKERMVLEIIDDVLVQQNITDMDSEKILELVRKQEEYV